MQAYSHKKLLTSLFALVILMFGFGFALVPMYKHLCQRWGINGKTVNAAIPLDGHTVLLDPNRRVEVQFIAQTNSRLPWLFYPKVTHLSVTPGKMAKLFFYAENQTDRTMTVQAIPSVTPGPAAKYLKKTECFCFTQQTLGAHEAVNMPLLFHLDQALPASIHTITLSYALFDVSNRLKIPASTVPPSPYKG